MANSVDFHTEPTDSLNGDVRVPGDKSISHRAAILAALAKGRSQINGFLMGADNYATIKAMQQMGVDIQVIDDEHIVIVEGVGMYGLQASLDPLILGNSGTALRLMTGLLSGQSFNSIVMGDESLSKRPMTRIVKPLRFMGAKISMTENNTPPLEITGRQSLCGIEYTLPVASAQVKSCLLLAGLYARGKTCVIQHTPVRDHLERILQIFGYSIRIENNKVCLTGGGKLYAHDINIPSDISSAAFFMVAAVITPNASIILRDVGINPTRIGVITILKAMGANIKIINMQSEGYEPIADIQVSYSQLRGIEIPVDQVPLAIDEFPVLFIAAACATGMTSLRGADELRVKETDRIKAMTVGLQALGIKAKVLADGVIIEGGKLHGGEVDSYSDHRIAMSFAVAGCIATGSIIIKNCENVATSFPNFVELGSSIGMNIRGYLQFKKSTRCAEA